MEDDDAPPDLVDVSQLPKSELQSSSAELPPQQRVPITLVTGTKNIL